MESKLADDMGQPTLAEILTEFRWLLTLSAEKCNWEQVINYFGHIEIYRREVVKKAKEALENGSVAPQVAGMLQKLADEDLSRRRRANYLATLKQLCLAHIRFVVCGEDDYLVPSLVKKYFPPPNTAPAWAPHIGLTESERADIAKGKDSIFTFLKEVNEWEEENEGDEGEGARTLYLVQFGDPFSKRASGRPTVGKVALGFAAKVENNANALIRLLNILG